jgi:Methyltransferase domain
MRPGGVVSKVRQRALGLPRTFGELNASLQLLAVLRLQGWQGSVRLGAAVDAHNLPLPWYSYPAIEWLETRIRSSDRVFEYGAGHSTLWYAGRVREVVAVEHDTGWADRIAAQAAANVILLRRTAMTSGPTSPYVSTLLEQDGAFDVITIDGAERVSCARTAPARLQDSGVVVFDNSDRPAYREGIEHLHSVGLQRIDLYGFSPGNGTVSCTSIFGRLMGRWGEDVPLTFRGT